QSTAHGSLHEVTAVVDRRERDSTAGPDLETALRAFGWAVARCDGNDAAAIDEALHALLREERPKLLLAVTRPVVGAFDEILERLNGRLAELGAAPVELARERVPPRRARPRPEGMVAAHGRALVELAGEEPALVALVAGT